MMQTVAWIASGLVFMSFYMRSAFQMRLVAILANLAFIAYALLGLQDGIFDKVLPILVLHISSLVLNIRRLREAFAVAYASRSEQVQKFTERSSSCVTSSI